MNWDFCDLITQYRLSMAIDELIALDWYQFIQMLSMESRKTRDMVSLCLATFHHSNAQDI